MGVTVVEENDCYKFLNPPGTTADTEYYCKQKNALNRFSKDSAGATDALAYQIVILLIQWRRIF